MAQATVLPRTSLPAHEARSVAKESAAQRRRDRTARSPTGAVGSTLSSSTLFPPKHSLKPSIRVTALWREHWPLQDSSYWSQEHRALTRSRYRHGSVPAPELPQNATHLVVERRVGGGGGARWWWWCGQCVDEMCLSILHHSMQ